MTDDPRSLDPNTYYRAADLLNRCDIPTATIAAARAAGRLKAVNVGTDRNSTDDGFRFRGSDVTDWLDAGAATTSTGKASATPRPADRAVPTVVRAFDSLVAQKVTAGLSKPEAVRAVVKENPELHCLYLAAQKTQQ